MTQGNGAEKSTIPPSGSTRLSDKSGWLQARRAARCENALARKSSRGGELPHHSPEGGEPSILQTQSVSLIFLTRLLEEG